MSTKVIFISGTPCVGKTTISNRLNKVMVNYFDEVEILSVNEFAFKNDLILGENEDKGYKVIDIEKLDSHLNKYIKDSENNLNKLIIVEGHLSHLCSECDKCIIFRLNPDILKQRLEDRNYSEDKVNENLEAEVLGVCSVESYQIHADKVNEIDVSKKSIDTIVDIVKNVILDKEKYPIGYIDFMDYIMKYNF